MSSAPARLSNFRREVVVATVLAYRQAIGEGLSDWQAWPATRAAYLAAGGDPETADTTIPAMISAAARDHGEWFWRPARARLERHERYIRKIGVWPPPKNWTDWPDVPADFA